LVSLNFASQCGHVIENGFENFWKFSSVIEWPQFGQGNDGSMVMIISLIKACFCFIILIVNHILIGTLCLNNVIYCIFTMNKECMRRPKLHLRPPFYVKRSYASLVTQKGLKV